MRTQRHVFKLCARWDSYLLLHVQNVWVWTGPSAAVKLTNRHHPNFSRSRTFYCFMLRHAEILRRSLDPLFGEQRDNKLNILMGLKKNVNCLHSSCCYYNRNR
jgi:hypothetical protein